MRTTTDNLKTSFRAMKRMKFLLVTIVEAVNLPAMDMSGTSDPYWLLAGNKLDEKLRTSVKIRCARRWWA